MLRDAWRVNPGHAREGGGGERLGRGTGKGRGAAAFRASMRARTEARPRCERAPAAWGASERKRAPDRPPFPPTPHPPPPRYTLAVTTRWRGELFTVARRDRTRTEKTGIRSWSVGNRRFHSAGRGGGRVLRGGAAPAAEHAGRVPLPAVRGRGEREREREERGRAGVMDRNRKRESI